MCKLNPPYNNRFCPCIQRSVSFNGYFVCEYFLDGATCIYKTERLQYVNTVIYNTH